MRTTVDIPEDLLRHARATATVRGVRLSDLVVEALGLALGQPPDAARRRAALTGRDLQGLGHGCVLPFLRGASGPALRDLTPERLKRLLDDEDAARTRRPR